MRFWWIFIENIDVRQLRLRLFEVCIDFLFSCISIMFLEDLTCVSVRMQIWIFSQIYLTGTNFGRVKRRSKRWVRNKLTSVRPSPTSPRHSEVRSTGIILRTSAATQRNQVQQMHMHPVLAGLHPHTQLFTHIQIETGLGPSTPTSWRAGTLIFFLSLGKSALWYEFRASWASPLDIVWEDQRKREPRMKWEAFLSSAQRDYRFAGTDKCNFFGCVLIHLHQGNGSALVDLACFLSSKKVKKAALCLTSFCVLLYGLLWAVWTCVCPRVCISS